MSAALKLASVATGLTVFSASALYALRTPQQDFSKNALAMEHIGERTTAAGVRPKLPSEFISFKIRGYEFKNAA